MAIIKKNPAPAESTGAASTGTGTATPAPAPEGAAPTPGAKLKAPGAKVEKYDETVAQAETYFIELVEFIQTKQLDRATVVASMMRARGITFETAQSQYSRMKKIFNNETVLEELKAGKITLKVARERTTDKQQNPASAAPEAKEARYTNTLKAFVAAAKESGFTLREILLGVEAELKSASIK
jgi:hypothetical protein